MIKKHMKRLAVLATAAVLCLGAVALAGCGSQTATTPDPGTSTEPVPEFIEFTDDCGRTVTIPSNIEMVVPSGHTATQVLLTLCPEKMASVSSQLDENVIKYLGVSSLKDLPVTGAAFGSKGDLNKETVAALGDASKMILVDTGELKDGIAEDLDALQSQLGIPCIFVETKLSDYGSAYAKLGKILGCEERGNAMSEYCKNAYDEITAVMKKIDLTSTRKNVAYIVGGEGVNAIAKGSYQGGVVDLVANNVVVVEKVSGKGSGNAIDLEQLANWDPEIILFQDANMYKSVANAAGWQVLSAVQNGKYCAVPNTPYCWLNNPPTVNQVMGMQWLSRLLYPEQFSDTVADVTKSYYKMFYNYDLSDAELASLTASATL